VSLEAVRVASALLAPVMPTKMLDIRRAIGMPDEKLSPDAAELGHLRALSPGAPLRLAESIFPRLDTEAPVNLQSPSAPEAAVDGLISIEDFSKVELAVAEVLSAAKVEGADRLLKLEIQVGDEKRPLVAGIAQHYQPEALVGRRIIIVKNLKPAKIRGHESRGMLLAAKKDGKVILLTTDGEIGSGAEVG